MELDFSTMHQSSSAASTDAAAAAAPLITVRGHKSLQARVAPRQSDTRLQQTFARGQ